MPEAVIIGGVRTPFVRAGEDLRDTPTPELGRLAVQELLYRCDVPPAQIDEADRWQRRATDRLGERRARDLAASRNSEGQDRSHGEPELCERPGVRHRSRSHSKSESGAVKTVVALGVDSMRQPCRFCFARSVSTNLPD